MSQSNEPSAHRIKSHPYMVTIGSALDLVGAARGESPTSAHHTDEPDIVRDIVAIRRNSAPSPNSDSHG